MREILSVVSILTVLMKLSFWIFYAIAHPVNPSFRFYFSLSWENAVYIDGLEKRRPKSSLYFSSWYGYGLLSLIWYLETWVTFSFSIRYICFRMHFKKLYDNRMWLHESWFRLFERCLPVGDISMRKNGSSWYYFALWKVTYIILISYIRLIIRARAGVGLISCFSTFFRFFST